MYIYEREMCVNIYLLYRLYINTLNWSIDLFRMLQGGVFRRSEKSVPSCVATWHAWMKSMESKEFFETVSQRPELLPRYLDAAKESTESMPRSRFEEREDSSILI